MEELGEEFKTPLCALLLSVADDKLFLGHCNADWTGLAPILEEDIAFSALAQDELAHASAIYDMVGGLLGVRSDDLAFGRSEHEYRCAAIVELADDFNWATAIARRFFCDHFDDLRLGRLSLSRYAPLAALTARIAAEERIHVDHVDAWISRLGRGGAEARQRVQQSLNTLGPVASMLFEKTEGQESLESNGLYPPLAPDMFEQWSQALSSVTVPAGLELRVQPPQPGVVGGRRGRHHPAFKSVLEEMCEVYREEPQASW